MAWAAIGIAAVSMVSKMQAASSRRKARRQQAMALEQQRRLMEAQADEILRRADINADIMVEQGKEVQAKQASGFAGAGVSLSSASVADFLQATATRTRENVLRFREEQKHRAELVRTQGMFLSDQAGQIRRAAASQYFSDMFSAATQFGTQAYRGYGTGESSGSSTGLSAQASNPSNQTTGGGYYA